MYIISNVQCGQETSAFLLDPLKIQKKYMSYSKYFIHFTLPVSVYFPLAKSNAAELKINRHLKYLISV